MFLPVDAPAPPLRPPSSAIGPSDWEVLARFWYPVALASEVVDTSFKARLLDVSLVLFRAGERVTAAVDMCPHRWVRLSAGKLRDGQIVCAFHGLSFDGSGQCTGIPSLGRSARLPSHYRLRTFRTTERYGMVWVCLNDASEATIPSYPSVAGADEGTIAFGAVCDWPMSAARQIENFFDLAHLPFIHASTLGGDPFARLDPPSIEHQKDAVIFRAKYVETVPVPKPTEFEFTYRVFLPFAIDFRTEAEGTTRLKSVNIASPSSAHTCRVFQLHVARAEGQASATAQNLHRNSGLGVIQQQDIDMLRELVVADLPLNPKLEIHLPVDNVSGAYRKRLQELGLSGT
jgi:phenylpropionate dioxygenase-like ring-hydroxylating dioxygenase large terminal subunit